MPSCKTFVNTGTPSFTLQGHPMPLVLLIIGLGIFALVGVGYLTVFLIRFCYTAWRDALGFSPQARFIRRFKREYPYIREHAGLPALEPDVLENVAELAWTDKRKCAKYLNDPKTYKDVYVQLAQIKIATDHPDFITLTWIRAYYFSLKVIHPRVLFHINTWTKGAIDRAPTYNCQHYEDLQRFILKATSLETTTWKGYTDQEDSPGDLPETPFLPYLSQMQLGFG